MTPFSSFLAEPCASSRRVMVLLALIGMAPSAQGQSFGPVSFYNNNNIPTNDIAVADLNRDGRPDLVTANDGSSVAVMLGTGTGSFGPATTYSTGPNLSSSAYSVAVADVNSDGKLDLLVANDNDNTAGVLLGTGTGSFGPASIYSTGTNSIPSGIVTADVNADGRPDLLTANYSSNTVGVLLGTGTGSFGPVSTYSTGASSGPVAIAVADVNRDGRPDVLTANRNQNVVGVLLGTGTGSFGAVTTLSTGVISGPINVAVADVNRDGNIDILTANESNRTAGVLLGTGPGSFGPVTTYSTASTSQPSFPADITANDVNGDGNLDLLVANSGTDRIGVFLGTGTGSFGAMTAYWLGGLFTPVSIIGTDVNGDGRPDLLTGNQSSGASVLLNTGTYTPLAARPATAAADISLAPNPAHDAFTVTLPAGTAATGAELLNALGQVVRRPVAAGPCFTVETAGLAPGLYSLRLSTGAGTVAQRVVVD